MVKLVINCVECYKLNETCEIVALDLSLTGVWTLEGCYLALS